MEKFIKAISEPAFWLMTYFWMMIFTFGSAYHSVPKGYVTWGGTFIEYGVFERSIGAFMASVGWPLYWSAKLWS
jgi:hypothetical protein